MDRVPPTAPPQQGGNYVSGGGSGRSRESDDRKLFIGGLPGACEKQHMDSYFSQFGPVEHTMVMYDRNTGRSRGFGFVVYSQLTDMETCLASGPHVLLEKTVDVKRASQDPPSHGGKGGGKGYSGGKGEYGGKGGYSGGKGSGDFGYSRGGPSEGSDNPCKVFVGGLPNSCDQARLHDHFSRYGTVAEALVMYDRETGRHRGFGYVIYSSPADANAAIAGGDANVIDDKHVEVKHARREGSRGKGKGRPMGSFGGGDAGGYGQRPPSYQTGGYRSPQPPMYSGSAYQQQPMMQQQQAGSGQYGGYGSSAYGGASRQSVGGGGYGPAAPPPPAAGYGGYPQQQGYGQPPQYRASPY
ncbi:pre-mRNA-splicing factor SF2, putative [Perkinsus marinus ATCC 50983]|uniref:Pre-mRNA-splicing factor SF2, putative n=1 Tax=Perkinsus marinus (strain ATCC 50983 / TXsc) TaxID=423536 RepID=C5LQZ9_PERM5|nr:pre-mRNA-splicing factor SF2, putative [Perkinsus marinus ATCC 50983]EER00884.1 pre-mRNA-splicing factor SF2, putative [Perkinsus marinus ATCC 50983]|eukprot:XP_002768166.1 pre-mRNA-splicing factor SF2, putative [Perkinsus marinus ATCC 50983]